MPAVLAVQLITNLVASIKLALLQAKYLFSLFTVTPIDRPLVIKELAFYTAIKTIL